MKYKRTILLTVLAAVFTLVITTIAIAQNDGPGLAGAAGDHTLETTPATIYVDQDATGGGNTGESWSDAYLDLQDALEDAEPGDEIWVAEGSYKPGSAGERSESFELPGDVAIYGGFAGGEDERNERDWETNVTVLSGDIDGDDSADPNGVITDTTHIAGSNSYHVVVIQGLVPIFADDMVSGSGNWNVSHGTGSDDWFLATNLSNSPTHSWRADSTGLASDQYLTLSSPVALGGDHFLRFWHYYGLSNFFEGGVVEISTDGGTSWSDLGSSMIQNGYNSVTGDSMGNPLGVREAFSGFSPGFIETIVDLSGYAGSNALIRFRLGTSNLPPLDGWYVDDVEFLQVMPSRLDGFTITGGQANGTGLDDSGGGLVINQGNASLANITFSGNAAKYYGGGMHVDVAYTQTLTNVAFIANHASYGGGLAIQGGSVNFNGGLFDNNQALGEAGGISAIGGGGGGGGGAGLGGAVFNDSGSVLNLTDVDLTNNVAMGGDGGSGQPNYGEYDGVGGRGGGLLGGDGGVTGGPNPGGYGGFGGGGGGGAGYSSAGGAGGNGGFGGGGGGGGARTGGGDGGPGGSGGFGSGNGCVGHFSGSGGGGGGAGLGGGIFSNGMVTIVGGAISGNSAAGGLGALSAYGWENGGDGQGMGGAIFSNGGVVEINGSLISNNSADRGGGFDSSGVMTVTDSTISGNYASIDGGGIYNDEGLPTLNNVIVSDNSVLYGGGGIYNWYGEAELTNVLFIDNSAKEGGAIANRTGAATLTNVTLSGNTATDYGGGIWNYQSNPIIANSIVWGNSADTGDQIYNRLDAPASTPVISTTLVQDSGGSDSWDGSLGVDGGGNIDEDPLFVDLAGGDLRLGLDSPAVNAGNNNLPGLSGITTDLGGRPRFVGVIDMGAYETPPALLYVDQDATGANDGSSWSDAFNELQEALTWAVDGVEIWTAAGNYKPDYDPVRDSHTGDQGLSFELTNGVSLYGGFAGGETGLEQRDPSNNVTVLSGDLEDDDGTDANGVITDTANIQGDNAQTVIAANCWGKTLSTLFSDNMESGSGNWNASHASGDIDWALVTNNPHSPIHSWFAEDVGYTTDQYLTLDSPIDLTVPTFLRFWHHFNTESGYDGGVVELSADGGPWTDLGPLMVKDGYNYHSYLGPAFSGDSGGFIETVVNMEDYTGSSVRIRFRLITDFIIGRVGWYLDDVEIIELAECQPARLDGFTITGGQGTLGLSSKGGGMYAKYGGSLTLMDVTYSGNQANYGGGIYVSGISTTMTDVSFSGNEASYGGGMYNNGGSQTMTDVSFSGNEASYGGGMYNNGGSQTMTDVSFSGNQASYGGGMFNNYSSPTLVEVSFSDNQASYGGGMYNYHDSSMLTDVSFSGNEASYYGGGTYNYYSSATMTDVSFSGNEAYYGGGVFVGNSSLTLVNSNVGPGNTVQDYGGGIYQSGGTLTITNTTVFSNTAIDGGGGIRINSGTLEMANCTVSDNLAASYGGGIFAYGTISMTNCTVTGNTADVLGASGNGGGGIYGYGTLTQVHLENSVIAGNLLGSGSTADGPDLLGDFTSLGCNLIGDASGSTGMVHGANDDQVGTGSNPIDPLLGDLALDSPGTTPTHRPSMDSPLVDQIPSGTNGCGTDLVSDQRGVLRPLDGDMDGTAACDIGAVELDIKIIYLPVVVR